MKQYEFKLVIKEGNDEFWESIESKSGCDEVEEVLRNALESYGFDDYNSSIALVRFSND